MRKESAMPRVLEIIQNEKSAGLQNISDAYKKEIVALEKAVDAFGEGEKDIFVRHCCSMGIRGYYVLTCGDASKVVPSEFRLAETDGEMTTERWYRIYAVQETLNGFLHFLESMLWHEHENVRFEMRQLYIDTIMDGTIEAKIAETGDTAMMADYKMKMSEYTRLHKADIAEWERIAKAGTESDDAVLWYRYYNEGCEKFLIISDILDKAAQEIYDKKEEMKAAGIWNRGKRAIKILRLASCEAAEDRKYLGGWLAKIVVGY